MLVSVVKSFCNVQFFWKSLQFHVLFMLPFKFKTQIKCYITLWLTYENKHQIQFLNGIFRRTLQVGSRCAKICMKTLLRQSCISLVTLYLSKLTYYFSGQHHTILLTRKSLTVKGLKYNVWLGCWFNISLGKLLTKTLHHFGICKVRWNALWKFQGWWWMCS